MKNSVGRKEAQKAQKSTKLFYRRKTEDEPSSRLGILSVRLLLKMIGEGNEDKFRSRKGRKVKRR